MVVHALAYSVLCYGIPVFGSSSWGWQDRINDLLKNILQSHHTFGQRHFFRTHSFKSLFTSTVVLCHYWTDDFRLAHVAPRQLRKETSFAVPRLSTRYGAARRCVYFPKIFNNLSDETFSGKSQSELKCLLLLSQESNVHIYFSFSCVVVGFHYCLEYTVVLLLFTVNLFYFLTTSLLAMLKCLFPLQESNVNM